MNHRHRLPRTALGATLLALALAAPGAAFAGKAHEHGVVKLDVAVDGATLTVSLDTPLDSVLGFERAPRTPAERRAADEALARLRNTAGLFTPSAAAACTPTAAEVTAPVLEAAPPAQKDGHADLEATYTWRCAQPAQLRELELKLFAGFTRMQRIEAQVAGATAQKKLTLRRPASKLPL